METIIIVAIILASAIGIGSILKYVRRVRINRAGLVLSMRRLPITDTEIKS